MIDFPANPTVGQTFQGWEWDGVKWISAPSSGGSGGSGGASITVSDTPPPNPSQGALWWESVNGQMYVFYTDVNSSQWVPTTNQMGGGYLPLSGGTLTGALNPAGGLIGVTDGSNAAAGQIGEFMNSGQPAAVGLTNVTPMSVVGFTLSPGDWDVWGWGIFSSSTSTSALLAGLSTTLNNLGVAYATAGNSTANSVRMTAPMIRISASASTPIWLCVQANFTTGPVTGTGQMSARRVR